AARGGIPVEAAAPAVAGPDVLTPRERGVLEQVAHGHTNRQVGAVLFISEKTVSVHLSRVMAKLGASSRTEAVSIAYSRGLLIPQVPA
ncbi:MAG: helix-turn-helix transcriptional regulator, partial [Pseudonocardia sp.]|nr:helix-turn-helix transcriptional regulator [Pseudonocardia sp.]